MGFQLPKQEPPVYAKPKGNERDRIMRMRTALVMSSPFYGLLAVRLKVKEDASYETAATDGKHFFYNPAYIAGMSDAKLRGLIGHETLHCTNGHCWRQGTRNHRLWNIACDYAIDQILVRGGFDVPNALVNPDWNGLSAEEIYAKLMQEVEKEQKKRQQQQQKSDQKDGEKKPQPGGEKPEPEEGDDDAGNDGENESDENGEGAGSGEGESGEGDQPASGGGEAGDGDPAQPNAGGGNGAGMDATLVAMFGEGPTKGEVVPAAEESALQDEADWKQAVVSAAKVAKAQGKLPADLELMVKDAVEPRIDWKAALRKFVQQCAALDYSWRTPNPRYSGMGVYLPRLKSEQMPPVVIVVDTSGSIGGEELKSFAAEVSSIIEEAKPEAAHLVFCDAHVGSTAEFLPGDPIVFKPTGGGGTDFRPPFAWVEEQCIDPACLIYLTDMYGTFPEEAPAYPVIWASTTKNVPDRYTPEFGDVIYLDLE